MPFLLFVLASLLYAAGGLCMKYSQGLTRLPSTLGVFVLFCAGAGCQAIGMKERELGSAYTLVLGLEAVMAMLLGVLVLGERMNAGKIGAIVVILLGIVLLERA